MRMFTFSAPKDGPWNSKIENINIGMFHVFLFHGFLALSVRISKTSGSSPTQTEGNSNREWSSYLLVRLL